MSFGVMLVIFAATSFFTLLPGPVAHHIANYSKKRGRRTGCASVCGSSAGLAVACLIALLPVLFFALAAPALIDTLSFAGLAYLMLYAFWCFQELRASRPAADNDNLPETQNFRIFSQLFAVAAFRRRHILLFGALSVQFIDTGAALLPQAMAMQASVLFGAVCGTALHVLQPDLLKYKRPFSTASKSAIGTRKARIISSRAVSAGYRRKAA